jgi:hypothetical protein
MKNYTLNVELISRKKLTPAQILDIKSDMDSKDDFLNVYTIFLDFMEINFNGFLEIYVEDLSLDSNLQEEIEMMINHLDNIIPGGLSNDSKIEWNSIDPPLNVVWYKENNKWIEKESELDVDFFIEDEWIDDEDFDDNYNGYQSGHDDEKFW